MASLLLPSEHELSGKRGPKNIILKKVFEQLTNNIKTMMRLGIYLAKNGSATIREGSAEGEVVLNIDKNKLHSLEYTLNEEMKSFLNLVTFKKKPRAGAE